MPLFAPLRRCFRIPSLILLPLVAALAGCAGDERLPTSPPGAAPHAETRSPDAAALARAIRAQDGGGASLLGLAGVVGTGVGVDAAGGAVIEVYCERDFPAGLPSTIDGVAVRPEIVGSAVPFALTDRLRPAPLGSSMGNNNECLPGTLGCVVTRRGERYVLCANHVLARQNLGANDEDIMQPSRPDASAACDPEGTGNRIARLSEFEPVVYDGKTPNVMDAAIARVTGDVSNATPPEYYGQPSEDPVEAAVGMKIQKVGRTTGLTAGKVKAINVKVKILFPAGKALFVNQVMTSKAFGDFGDSGSLVVTNNKRRNPIGIVIGGTGTGKAIVSPIGPILERFGVRIDGSN